MYAGFIKFLNQPLRSSDIKSKYNIAIEQYRGVCALLVMITHGFVDTNLLFNKFSWPEFVKYCNAGYLSVMIFFCISGYVIGITNKNKFSISQYLKKRAIRLYPTYLISIVLCIIIAGGVSLYVLLGNVFFLQNGLSYYNINIPVFVNYVTWSLNNEVLYYLLFIPIIIWQPKLWKVLLCLFILSLALIPATKPYLFLSGYVDGYYFWILGLLFGWNLIKGNSLNNIQSIPFLSLLFLHLCINHLGLGQIILHTIGIYTLSNLNWLFDLPFCFLIMGVLTEKHTPIFNFNKGVCYALPAFVFLYLFIHNRIFEDTRWIMCLILWILSLLFFFEKKISAFIMSKFTGIGAISYALYLMHIPVAMLIKKTVFINNQVWEIPVKYALWIGITFLLSYILEIHLQPAVKRLFTAK